MLQCVPLVSKQRCWHSVRCSVLQHKHVVCEQFDRCQTRTTKDNKMELIGTILPSQTQSWLLTKLTLFHKYCGLNLSLLTVSSIQWPIFIDSTVQTWCLVCVCMCACVHVCMCACVHVWVNVCVCCVCMCVLKFTCGLQDHEIFWQTASNHTTKFFQLHIRKLYTY